MGEQLERQRLLAEVDLPLPVIVASLVSRTSASVCITPSCTAKRATKHWIGTIADCSVVAFGDQQGQRFADVEPDRLDDEGADLPAVHDDGHLAIGARREFVDRIAARLELRAPAEGADALLLHLDLGDLDIEP